MIVSNTHRYIYLRVPKTGSTSVSAFLYRHCLLEDNIIHTGLDTRDLDANDYNYVVNAKVRDDRKKLMHGNLTSIVKNGLLEHDLSDYKVFAVCRHPVDRFISFVKMIVGNDINDSICQYFIENQFTLNNIVPQTHWLKHNNVPISSIYKYENVNNLVAQLASFYNVIDIQLFERLRFRQSTSSYIPARSVQKKILSYYYEDFEIYNNFAI